MKADLIFMGMKEKNEKKIKDGLQSSEIKCIFASISVTLNHCAQSGYRGPGLS